MKSQKSPTKDAANKQNSPSHKSAASNKKDAQQNSKDDKSARQK